MSRLWFAVENEVRGIQLDETDGRLILRFKSHGWPTLFAVKSILIVFSDSMITLRDGSTANVLSSSKVPEDTTVVSDGVGLLMDCEVPREILPHLPAKRTSFGGVPQLATPQWLVERRPKFFDSESIAMVRRSNGRVGFETPVLTDISQISIVGGRLLIGHGAVLQEWTDDRKASVSVSLENRISRSAGRGLSWCEKALAFEGGRVELWRREEVESEELPVDTGWRPWRPLPRTTYIVLIPNGGSPIFVTEQAPVADVVVLGDRVVVLDAQLLANSNAMSASNVRVLDSDLTEVKSISIRPSPLRSLATTTD